MAEFPAASDLIASLFKALDGNDEALLWETAAHANAGQTICSRSSLRPEESGDPSTLLGNYLKKALLSTSENVQLAAIHLCTDFAASAQDPQRQDFVEAAISHGIADYLVEVARTAMRGNGLPLLHSTLLCLAALGSASDKFGLRMAVGAETILRALSRAVDGGFLPTYVPAAQVLAFMFVDCQPRISADQTSVLLKDLCAGLQRFPASSGDRGSAGERQACFLSSAAALAEFLKWFSSGNSSSAFLKLGGDQLKICIHQVTLVLRSAAQTEAINEELLVLAMKLMLAVQSVVPSVESLSLRSSLPESISTKRVLDPAPLNEVQALESMLLCAIDMQLVPCLLVIEGTAEAHPESLLTGLQCLYRALQLADRTWSYRLATKLASAGFMEFLLTAENIHVAIRSGLLVKVAAESIQLPDSEVQKLVDPDVLAYVPASVSGLLNLVSGAAGAVWSPNIVKQAQCAAFLILHAVLTHHEGFSPRVMKSALCAHILESAHGHHASTNRSAWEPALLGSLWAMLWMDTTDEETAVPWHQFLQQDEMVAKALSKLLNEDGAVKALAEGLWPASLFRWILHQRDLESLATGVVSRWLLQAAARRLHSAQCLQRIPKGQSSASTVSPLCACPAESAHCPRGIQALVNSSQGVQQDSGNVALGNVILGILDDVFMEPQEPRAAELLWGLVSALESAGNIASTLLALGLAPKLQTALLLHVRNMCPGNKRAFLEFVEALILHTSTEDALGGSGLPAFVQSLVQHICVEADIFHAGRTLARDRGSEDIMVSALNVCNIILSLELTAQLRAHEGPSLPHQPLAARGPHRSSADVLTSSDSLQKLTSVELKKVLGSICTNPPEGDTVGVGITGLAVCSAFFQLQLRMLQGCFIGEVPCLDVAQGPRCQGEDIMCFLTAFTGLVQPSPPLAESDPLKEVLAVLALQFVLVAMGPSPNYRSTTYGPPLWQPTAVLGVLQNAANSPNPLLKKNAFLGLAALVHVSQEAAVAVASCPWTRRLCEQALTLQTAGPQQGLEAMIITTLENSTEGSTVRASFIGDGSIVAASLLHAGVEPSWLLAGLEPQRHAKLPTGVKSSDSGGDALAQMLTKVNGVTVFADWDTLARVMCVLLRLPWLTSA